MTTKKTLKILMSSQFWKNGMTLKHDILHKGTYVLSPKDDGAEILILILLKKFSS